MVAVHSDSGHSSLTSFIPAFNQQHYRPEVNIGICCAVIGWNISRRTKFACSIVCHIPIAPEGNQIISTLALYDVAALYAAKNWGVAMGTIIFMTLFSQYLRNVSVPFVAYKNGKWQSVRLHIFKLFPVLLTIVVMWAICAIITVTNGFSEEDDGRTDKKLFIIQNASWFRFPYPCK